MINGVRQFKLINANGAEYDMTRNLSLFIEPNGLGWGQERTVERLGMTYIATDVQEIRQSPTGSMLFRTYQEYANFLAFCQVGGLVLAYRPIEAWFYLKVLISIGKSEIAWENNHLTCPVTFTATSYWYEQVTAQTAEGGEAEGGKTYAYSYAYTYGLGRSNLFNFNLNLESYFKLTIFGEATNPQWRVLQNGEVIHTGRLTGFSVQSGQKLVINTNPKEMEIATYTLKDVRIASAYGYSVWSTERIFALPQGESQLQVLTDDETLPTVMIEVLHHV